jgi:dTDP-4-dehydrorhamnose reductase
MKNLLILGCTGMLGSEVLKVFSKNKEFKITATYREKESLIKLKKNFNYETINLIKFIKFNLNKSYESSLKKLMKKSEYIINCIGTIKPFIDEGGKKIENPILVNSIFPNLLNKYKNKKNKIYQIATDCVFSGKKLNGSYLENSEHDATDIYGKTKSLGEVKDKNFFNIRCSIIGKEIKNYVSLFEWFNKQKYDINGFTNHLWNGLSTNVFSELLKTIIINNIDLPNIIHIIPKDKISKYTLLKYFKLISNNKKIKINKKSSQHKINRTLDTKYHSKNLEIWNRSIYTKQLNLKSVVKTVI